MKKNRIIQVLAIVSCIAAKPGVQSHPGSLDINGGHYFGPSYHCHMAGCTLPDSFDPMRRRRDGVMTNYRGRERFFNEDDWSFEEDFDQDCQSTRQEMLIMTSKTEVKYTNPRNCVVRTGEWSDEYTGRTFTVAVQIDIDHIIPRMYAHTHGGDRWMPDKKIQFSNDPLNLVLVEKREIRRKSDRGPSRYMPRDEFKCEYAQLWDVIANKYGIQLESSDRNEIRRVLQGCPDDALGSSTAQ